MWPRIFAQVLTMPAGENLRVELPDVPHPREVGFRASVGLGDALAHWRLACADGRGLHVLEARDHYLVHWDRVDPSVSVVQHLYADAPRVAVPGGAALGAALGGVVGGVVGAVVGGVVGAVLGLGAHVRLTPPRG